MGADDLLNRRLKMTALALGWMLIAAGALWALTALWPVAQWIFRTLSPFLVALVLAYLFNPVVNVAQRRFKLGRVGGIVLVAVVIVLILAIIFGVLAPILTAQAVSLVEAIRESTGRIAERFSSESAKLYWEKVKIWLDQADAELRQAAKNALSAAPGMLQEGAQTLQSAAKGIGAVFTGIGGFIATLVLALVITFYYLVEFDSIPRVIRLLVPRRAEQRTMEILERVDRAVGGFLRGQAIVCSLIAVLASIGLFLIGMKQYAVLVGVIAGVANIIPYLGPAMGALPALLWALLAPSHDTWTSRLIYAGLVLGLFGLIQMLDGFVFQPRIVGKNSNLHPLAVMLALVVGAQFGLAGMIVAVPAACVARVLFLELWWTRHVEARMSEAPSKPERHG